MCIFNFFLFCFLCVFQLDPFRMFYESLYKQNPSSEMAEKWCLQHGILDADTAKKVLIKIEKGVSSSSSSSYSRSTPQSSPVKKKPTAAAAKAPVEKKTKV